MLSVQWKKDSLFNKKLLEQLDNHRQMNFDLNLTFYTKIKSMWITDLSVKCRTIKLRGGKKGERLHILKLGKRFSYLTTKT